MNDQKAVFIVYNQALTEQVEQAVRHMGLRGYTRWNEVLGTGTHRGEPHLGTHVWPAINSATLVITTASEAQALLVQLQAINEHSPEQGLRAFVWNVEEGV